MTPNAKGALMALLSFAIFATHDVVVKFLGSVYSPIQLVFFSVLLSFPLATLMLMRDNQPGTLLPIHPWWMAVRSAAASLTGLSAYYAFSTLPLAQVYSILFAAPLIITVLSIPMLGERVGAHRWAAVLVGLVGVLIVLRPGGTSFELGHFAALAAAFGGALNSVVVRKIGQDERPVVLLIYPMVTNFLLMGGLLWSVYEPMPFEHLGMLAVIAVLAWLAGLGIIYAYKSGEAVIVAPMQYSQIIWASFFGFLIFDETLDIATAAGSAVIIASGLYIVLREALSGTSANRPVLRTRSRPDTGTSLRISPFLPSSIRFRRDK